MYTFRVVGENKGWAVRVGDGMSTPFRTKDMAIWEAQRLCDELKRHGVGAEVVVQDALAGCASRRSPIARQAQVTPPTVTVRRAE